MDELKQLTLKCQINNQFKFCTKDPIMFSLQKNTHVQRETVIKALTYLALSIYETRIIEKKMEFDFKKPFKQFQSNLCN